MSGQVVVVDFATGLRVGTGAALAREQAANPREPEVGLPYRSTAEIAADIRQTRKQLERAVGAGDTERSSALRAQLSRLKVERDRLHRGGAA